MNGLGVLIEQQRCWLALQPEFRAGWDQGCIWFRAIVEQCFDDHIVLYVARRDRDQLADTCRESIAAAFLYHWQTARDFSRTVDRAVSGTWVMKVLQSGHRPTTPDDVEGFPRSMGGDPLRDLVLTTAAGGGAERAIEGFYLEYRSLFETEAQRVLGRGTPVADWEDLVSRLLFRSSRSSRTAETESEPPVPLLSRYRGYTSLRNWLRPVIRNFLTDAWRQLDVRKRAERQFAEQQVGRLSDATRAGDLDPEHPLEIFRGALREAATQLTLIQQQVLYWAYQEGLPNVEVAQRLGVVPGNASRLRLKALFHLSTALQNTLSHSLSSRIYGQASADWHRIAADLSPPVLGQVVRALGGILNPEGASRPSSIMATKDYVYGSDLRHADAAHPPTRDCPNEEAPLRPSENEGQRGYSFWLELAPSAFYSVSLDDNSDNRPEVVARALRSMQIEERPTVICLDARRVARAERVLDWLDRFDAHLSDGETPRNSQVDSELPEPDDDETTDFYEPRRVVMASKEVTDDIIRTGRLLYGDVTCVPSESTEGDAYTMYTQFINETFQRAFTPPQKPQEPVPTNLRSLRDTLSQAQKDEWDEKMKSLTEGLSGGSADFAS